MEQPNGCGTCLLVALASIVAWSFIIWFLA